MTGSSEVFPWLSEKAQRRPSSLIRTYRRIISIRFKSRKLCPKYLENQPEVFQSCRGNSCPSSPTRYTLTPLNQSMIFQTQWRKLQVNTEGRLLLSTAWQVLCGLCIILVLPCTHNIAPARTSFNSCCTLPRKRPIQWIPRRPRSSGIGFGCNSCYFAIEKGSAVQPHGSEEKSRILSRTGRDSSRDLCRPKLPDQHILPRWVHSEYALPLITTSKMHFRLLDETDLDWSYGHFSNFLFPIDPYGLNNPLKLYMTEES